MQKSSDDREEINGVHRRYVAMRDAAGCWFPEISLLLVIQPSGALNRIVSFVTEQSPPIDERDGRRRPCVDPCWRTRPPLLIRIHWICHANEEENGREVYDRRFQLYGGLRAHH